MAILACNLDSIECTGFDYFPYTPNMEGYHVYASTLLTNELEI
jgi:hypothetical protein